MLLLCRRRSRTLSRRAKHILLLSISYTTNRPAPVTDCNMAVKERAEKREKEERVNAFLYFERNKFYPQKTLKKFAKAVALLSWLTLKVA